jgi:hypothetical protein
MDENIVRKGDNAMNQIRLTMVQTLGIGIHMQTTPSERILAA